MSVTFTSQQFHSACRNASAFVSFDFAFAGRIVSRRWKSIIKLVVLAESTFHWLATVVGTPATNNAHDIPITPSPAPTLPRAVWQAESTANFACRSILMISRASNKPSSFGSTDVWAKSDKRTSGCDCPAGHALRSEAPRISGLQF